MATLFKVSLPKYCVFVALDHGNMPDGNTASFRPLPLPPSHRVVEPEAEGEVGDLHPAVVQQPGPADHAGLQAADLDLALQHLDPTGPWGAGEGGEEEEQGEEQDFCPHPYGDEGDRAAT